MATLSAAAYFLSRHPFWSLLLLIAGCNGVALLLSHWTGSKRWLWLCVIGVAAGIANLPGGRHLNAWFLHARGTAGSATVVGIDEVPISYSEQAVFAYRAVLRTADGADVNVDFDTLNVALYPPRASDLLPPPGEPFAVRYVPGFERNIAIMVDESGYGRRHRLNQDREPVRRAAAQLAVSPRNPRFAAEYRDAVRMFLRAHRDALDPAEARALEDSVSAAGR